MAGFDVSQEVEDLTYDFTKFVADAKGTIPEPSNDQLSAFRQRIVQLLPIAAGPDGKPTVDVATLVEKYGNEDGAKGLERELYQCIADLCSEQPTADQIAALPYRGQRAFTGWIVGTFLSPEA